MSAHALQNIEQLEDSLWAAADNLRANSKLTSSEYCMPVLGVIFLRHATNRYDAASRQIAVEQAAGKMPKRPLVKQDFIKRRALMLPKEARYDELLKLPKGANLGAALVDAMNAIERDFEPLLNQLPKDYDKFENDLLEDLLRIFDSEILRTATGDLFGRIYEYFLMKFAMKGAQDNGEFFTPADDEAGAMTEVVVDNIKDGRQLAERWSSAEADVADYIRTGVLQAHVLLHGLSAEIAGAGETRTVALNGLSNQPEIEKYGQKGTAYTQEKIVVYVSKMIFHAPR
jgi:type I restriction-modification system DNA methylase subunit